VGESAEEQRERELKFDIPHDWALPDPAKLVPDGGTVEQQVVHLQTQYFDTDARHLLHSRLTLRKRTGDLDAGWQLKVPDGDARIEIRLPLGGRGVPEELRTATLGVRAGAALHPVATLNTERAIHRIVDAAGVALAEIVVDAVTATQTREFAVTSTWREVEVELIEGDEHLLAKAARWLGKRGAVPSDSGSKLARALGSSGPAVRDPFTLHGLVGTYLDVQYEAIVRGDLDLRRGIDAIHATRVATRRYRSVLRVLAEVLDPGRAAVLDDELAWYASALGEVRDRHVLRGHLDALLDGAADAEAARPSIDATLAAELEAAEAALDTVMRSRRYYALLTELREWREQLPMTDEKPASRVARYLDQAEKTVRKRLKHVPDADAGDSESHDEARHRARKAAKRARYVAEMSEPELGGRARASVKKHKKIQEQLGDQQDVVVAADFLRRVAAGADASTQAGFALGLLYARERG
jgi:CHAD domain-containing protein